VVIGNNVSINPYTILYGHGGLKIGNNTRIAAHVMVIPAEHNYEDRNTLIRLQQSNKQGIEIGEDVWIGAGAKILDGTRIEKGCVIGANAVLKGKTDPYGVYVGIPARKIKERQ
jgi:acetyltransferase-like isoleucine patch superfamily enzyme